MITDPNIQAKESRDIFVAKSTASDVEKWQSEIEKFRQDVVKIQDEILATTDRANVEQSKLRVLKNEFSLDSVTTSVSKELVSTKTIETLEERLEALRNRIPKLESEIRERQRDIFDVGNNLAIAEISEDFIKWIDNEFLPLQEKYLGLRRELVQRLQQPHHLKIGERDFLKGIGNCQYLAKVGERKFQVKNTANDPKY